MHQESLDPREGTARNIQRWIESSYEVRTQCVNFLSMASNCWSQAAQIIYGYVQLGVVHLISQMQRSIWCVCDFLNVKVRNGGNIIYYFKSSLGEVVPLRGLVPNMFARLVIDNKISPSLQPNKFSWHLRMYSFSLWKNVYPY